MGLLKPQLDVIADQLATAKGARWPLEKAAAAERAVEAALMALQLADAELEQLHARMAALESLTT